LNNLELRVRAKSFGLFLKFVFKRFGDDDGTGLAAGLSYTTLLALVPLVVIALAIFAAFPAFESVRGDLQAMILESLLPTQKDEVRQWMTGFIENARSMTGPGVVFLGVTAIMLLMRIHAALDKIWKVTAKRPLVTRILTYWALLTIGPILLGLSLSVTGYVYAVVEEAGSGLLGTGAAELGRLVGLLLNTAAFSFLYVIMPNRAIRWRDGFVGAFVAAGLFEILKNLFAIYVAGVPSYQAIYGALASVPIFLLWMYIVWMVILLGAEVAAALPEWQAYRRRQARVGAPIDRLPIALILLDRLLEASEKGDALRGRTLRYGLPATLPEIDEVMVPLEKKGYILRSSRGRFGLGRDLRAVTLGDLLKVLGLDLGTSQGWQEPARGVIGQLRSETEALESRPLIDVLEAHKKQPAEPDAAQRVAE
jgi:membrane protein